MEMMNLGLSETQFKLCGVTQKSCHTKFISFFKVIFHWATEAHNGCLKSVIKMKKEKTPDLILP